jgi:starch synthase
MLPKPDIIQLLSHASVFACPSIYEPLGIVNLEAMACGAAVVATATGGIPAVVVDGETGLLIADPHDLAACAAAIETILADPDRTQAMGEAGRQRVIDRYLAIHRLREYVELLSGLIE